HNLHAVSYLLANCGNQAFRLVHLFVGEVFVCSPERIEFQSEVTALNHSRRGLGELLWGSTATVPTVGVSRKPVLGSATEELVKRLATGFADQVPEGNFHPADGRQDGAAVLILIANHVLDDPFDII